MLARSAAMIAPPWVDGLRAAVRGARVPAQPGTEVLHGARPAWLAQDAVDAVTSTLLASLIVAAALLRTELARGQFDFIALLLRTASLAFCLRAFIALVRYLARLTRDASAARHALAWSPDGLYLTTGTEEFWAARDEVIGFVSPDDRTARTLVSSLRPLFVVLAPARVPRYRALPPYFATDAEVLRARLERWRGEVAPSITPATRDATTTHATDTTSSEARYRRIAEGKAMPSEVAVPEGFGYRLRAPYGLLLALVFVADALHAAGPLRARLLPSAALAAGLSLLALPAWFAWVRTRRRARLGIALALTDDELLVRGKHGVLSVGYDELTEVVIASKRSWSPYVGGYLVRVLWLSVRDGSRISMDEAFLGVPADVIAKLIEHYRAG